MDGEALVRDYVGRLEAAAWPLPPDRKGELVGEVREHIEAALIEAGARDEVTVRNVLERLGRPEEIVAEEAGPAMPGAAPAALPPAAQSTLGAVEIVAILMLTIGSLILPIFGALIGLVFVAASSRWTTREKLIATAIVVGLLVLVPLLGRLGVGSGVI